MFSVGLGPACPGADVPGGQNAKVFDWFTQLVRAKELVPVVLFNVAPLASLMLGGVTGAEKFESARRIVRVTALPPVFATDSVVPSCCEKPGACRPVTARSVMVTVPEVTVGQVRLPVGLAWTSGFVPEDGVQGVPFTVIEKSARASGAAATMARTLRKPVSLFIYSPPFGMSIPAPVEQFVGQGKEDVFRIISGLQADIQFPIARAEH
jgi:hypothetical protein